MGKEAGSFLCDRFDQIFILFKWRNYKMKKNILILLIIAVLVLVSPVLAKGKVPMGDRINVLTGTPTSFSANSPFHINHGWVLSVPDDGPIGSYYFTLDVDGVMVAADYRTRGIESTHPTNVKLLWWYNFPSGMGGTHTFTGHWYGHCQTAVDNGSYPGPCPSRDARVELKTHSVTVTFH
jgi:hypothetical protein